MRMEGASEHHLSSTRSEDSTSEQSLHQERNFLLVILPNFLDGQLHDIVDASDLPPPTRYVRRPRTRAPVQILPSYSSFEDVSG